MSKSNMYTNGGAVQAGSGIYIKRNADFKLLKHCQNRDYVHILCPRQVGKSSLMYNVAETLKSEGSHSAVIDLTTFGHGNSSNQWYLGILTHINKQLGLDVDIFEWWKKFSNLGSVDKFVKYFHEILLVNKLGNIVVFFDEIDTTLGISFSDDFFAAIRYMYNARAIYPEFNRLSFVLIGVATPNELIRDKKRTPFNIGYKIDLEDFTFDEAMPLSMGLKGNSEYLFEKVYEWSNGHPYFTQVICLELSKKDRILSLNDVKKVIEILFLDSKDFGKKDDNLRVTQDFILKRSANSYKVLEIYKDILEKKRVTGESYDGNRAQLLLSGIVKISNNLLIPRNKIYSTVFDKAWIESNLQKENWRDKISIYIPVISFIVAIITIYLSILSFGISNGISDIPYVTETADLDAQPSCPPLDTNITILPIREPALFIIVFDDSETGSMKYFSDVGKKLAEIIIPGDQVEFFRMGGMDFSSNYIGQISAGKYYNINHVLLSPDLPGTPTPYPTPATENLPSLEILATSSAFDRNILIQQFELTQIAYENNCTQVYWFDEYKKLADIYEIRLLLARETFSNQLLLIESELQDILISNPENQVEKVYEAIYYSSKKFESDCVNFGHCILILIDDLKDSAADIEYYKDISLIDIDVISILSHCQTIDEPSCQTLVEKWENIFALLDSDRVMFVTGDDAQNIFDTFLGEK